MAVPRKKVSRARRGKRRSGWRLAPVNLVEDKQSGQLHRPHHMLPRSGLYRGRQILRPKEAGESEAKDS